MKPGDIVVGKYRLNQPLGTGGMAEVWSATNTFTERQIAIKFMNQEVAKTPEAAARFLKEAKVSARINHPNIIDIHDVGQTEEGQLFLVMELLTGSSLEVALRRQDPPMTLYELALVMTEVADALAAAHKSGIVHRDLKPSNVFLHTLRDGIAIPKLLDFGVSKFLEDDHVHALTVAGTVLGSPLYMSPEQARGDSHVDGRTDVFAFGAILFEALTGFRAYDAKNFNALIVKIATTRPKNIDEHAPEVADSFRAVVRACLEPDLGRRIQTFDEVVAMMKAAAADLQPSSMCLPAPLISPGVVDPEPAHALPIVRTSERPPANGGHDTIPGHTPGALSGTLPAYPSTAPTGPSWHASTPNTSYASIHVPAPAQSRTPWLVAAGALTLAALLGTGLVVASKRIASNTSASAAMRTQAPPPAPETTAPASADEPPTMSVDALPSAGKTGAVVAAARKGYGRLDVSASPGWCSIAVDGKERGPSPVAAIDLPAGRHTVTCRTEAGRSRSAVVRMQDGVTTKHKFSLD